MAFEILTYNTVPLQILASKEKIGRRHVMSDDRTTYLHTEWVFDVITQLNPATMGLIQNLFTTGALAGLAGTSGVNMPATIDAFLRIILNRPRGSLVFSQSSDGVNYNVVLNVPNNPANLTGLAGTQTDPNAASNGGVAFLTDCTGGPIVEAFDIVKDHAAHTWNIYIRIVTRVRECPFTFSSDPKNASNPIISNRWVRTMDTDDQALSYIETTGEVVFDAAWLLAMGSTVGVTAKNLNIQSWSVVPDQYRLDLFQPIPPNCAREHINVVQLSDGITYRYSFRDQERFYNTLPACRFEAFQTEGYSQMSQESAIARSVVDRFADPHAGFAAFGVGSFFATRFQTIIRTIPQRYTHVLVRAWGNRNTPKWTLLAQAFSIANSRMPTLTNVELVVTWELSGKYVEVQMTNRSGPEVALPLLKQAVTGVLDSIQTFRNQAVAGNLNLTTLFGINGLPSLSSGTTASLLGLLSAPENDPQGLFDQNETRVRDVFIRNLSNPDWAAAFPTGPDAGASKYYGNMQPPNSNSTRGTLICGLIAQALHAPCTPPPCPPAPAILPDVQTCPAKVEKPGLIVPPQTPPPAPNVGKGTIFQDIKDGQQPPPLGNLGPIINK